MVLVHGARADGSSWSKIIPLLLAKGLNAVAVQNSLTSIADDVAATNRIINAQDGPVSRLPSSLQLLWPYLSAIGLPDWEPETGPCGERLEGILRC